MPLALHPAVPRSSAAYSTTCARRAPLPLVRNLTVNDTGFVIQYPRFFSLEEAP
jgi:hypothetical protein